MLEITCEREREREREYCQGKGRADQVLVAGKWAV